MAFDDDFDDDHIDEAIRRYRRYLEGIFGFYPGDSFWSSDFFSNFETDRTFYDIIEHKDCIKVVVKLPWKMEAKNLNDVEYGFVENKLLIKDIISNSSIAIDVPFDIKSVNNASYKNRVLDMELAKGKQKIYRVRVS